MTAQRIRSGSDASGIPVPLSKVLPQRLAESVHQIRFIANRASNTKDLAFADSAEHPDTLYQLYPDGVEAFGREHAHARQLVRRLMQEAEQALYGCDSLLSWREEGSLAYRFNTEHQADMSEMKEVFEDALQVSKDSQGAFDLTVLPLSQLWNFDRFGDSDFDVSSKRHI